MNNNKVRVATVLTGRMAGLMDSVEGRAGDPNYGRSATIRRALEHYVECRLRPIARRIASGDSGPEDNEYLEIEPMLRELVRREKAGER